MLGEFICLFYLSFVLKLSLLRNEMFEYILFVENTMIKTQTWYEIYCSIKCAH